MSPRINGVLPYESETRDLNYRLQVAYNNNNIVSKNIMMRSATYTLDIAYKKSCVQMQQAISSIALWNPVASIVVSSSLFPIQSTQTSLPKDVGNSDTNFSDNGNNYIF